MVQESSKTNSLVPNQILQNKHEYTGKRDLITYQFFF